MHPGVQIAKTLEKIEKHLEVIAQCSERIVDPPILYKTVDGSNIKAGEMTYIADA